MEFWAEARLNFLGRAGEVWGAMLLPFSKGGRFAFICYKHLDWMWVGRECNSPDWDWGNLMETEDEGTVFCNTQCFDICTLLLLGKRSLYVKRGVFGSNLNGSRRIMLFWMIQLASNPDRISSCSILQYDWPSKQISKSSHLDVSKYLGLKLWNFYVVQTAPVGNYYTHSSEIRCKMEYRWASAQKEKSGR